MPGRKPPHPGAFIRNTVSSHPPASRLSMEPSRFQVCDRLNMDMLIRMRASYDIAQTRERGLLPWSTFTHNLDVPDLPDLTVQGRSFNAEC
jgi:hypothetical protein